MTGDDQRIEAIKSTQGIARNEANGVPEGGRGKQTLTGGYKLKQSRSPSRRDTEQQEGGSTKATAESDCEKNASHEGNKWKD